MPSNKPKQHFLVAADKRGDFYRAYTEKKARKVAAVTGADVYYIQGPLCGMKWHYSALDNATLLVQTMEQSNSLRAELLNLIVDQLCANPEKRADIVDKMRETEKEIRLANLTLDAEEALFDKYGESYEDNLTYRQLRNMPRSDFREQPDSYGIDVETISAITEHLEAVDSTLYGMGNAEWAKAAARQILKAPVFDARTLVDLALEAGIGFGDRDYDDDYDEFNGERNFGEIYFDVREAVMRHWDEVSTREKSPGEGLTQTFAFAVGQQRRATRAVYVQGDFVREHGRKLEL